MTWRLRGDLGRRYAAVSGDHNPIHLYPLTAKALGFKRQIAHGMWSLARCVAALENRLPDAVTVDAAFKKPIFLPGTVAFGQDADARTASPSRSPRRTAAPRTSWVVPGPSPSPNRPGCRGPLRDHVSMDVRPAETDHDLDEVRRLFNSFLAWHRQRHSDDLDLIEAYFDDAGVRTRDRGSARRLRARRTAPSSSAGTPGSPLAALH